jgi:hypothetical protein
MQALQSSDDHFSLLRHNQHEQRAARMPWLAASADAVSKFDSGWQLQLMLCLNVTLNTHHLGKHSGAVLPLPSAPVGRGVDGIDAMA